MSDQSPEPFAPSAPAGIPYATAVERTERLSQTWLVLFVTAAVLYALACVAAIFAVNSWVSLVDRILQGDQTVTLDQANSAEDNASGFTILLLILFVLFCVAGFFWRRNFNDVLGETQAAKLRRYRRGLRFAWVGWIVLWLVGTVVAQSAQSDQQSVVSAGDWDMALLSARALLVVTIAVMTVIANKRAQGTLEQRTTAQPFAPLSY
jgi:hypothetical protein